MTSIEQATSEQEYDALLHLAAVNDLVVAQQRAATLWGLCQRQARKARADREFAADHIKRIDRWRDEAQQERDDAQQERDLDRFERDAAITERDELRATHQRLTDLYWQSIDDTNQARNERDELRRELTKTTRERNAARARANALVARLTEVTTAPGWAGRLTRRLFGDRP